LEWVVASGSWLSFALRRDVVARSTRVALLVGTILALINHGGRLLAMDLDGEATLKILLTYLVPYCVSTWASVQALRAAAQPPVGSGD
jgi:hypothetical protein